jgi:beta-glucosidase
MPGPGRALGTAVLEAVNDGRVDKADLDSAIKRLLRGLDAIGALDQATPEVNPVPPDQKDVALIRRASAAATVLLVNDATLPLEPSSLRRLAVLGPHAERARMVGGGSAAIIPHRPVSPLGTLREALPATIDIVHERGCEADRSSTVIGTNVLRAPAGFEVEIFEGSSCAGDARLTRHLDELRMFVFSSLKPDDYPEGDWSARVRGTVIADESGAFDLALAQSGRARVLIDGELVLDGFASPPPKGGTDFFGQASKDLVAQRLFTAGTPIDVTVEYDTAGAVLPGMRLGFRTSDTDGLLDRALGIASQTDAALVFVGTTEEWESEGFDRPSLALPGRQDELIQRVAAVNPRTIVVVNAGAPVEMPWADEVAAVLQCWFGGQEMDNAVVDVLTGREEPGGRLATTVPYRLEHNPSFDNFPGENGELRYGEGLFMGYRGYEHRRIQPRFPFGYGLSYTTFEWGELSVSSTTYRPGDRMTVSVPVTNTGHRPGSEVVQCYVAPLSPRLARPAKELKAFAKVRVSPGETATANLHLDDRSFAYWDPGQRDLEEVRARIPSFSARFDAPVDRRRPGWTVDPGRYELLLGRSSADILARIVIEIPKTAG